MKFETFTLRPLAHQNQKMVRHTVDVNPHSVTSIHDPSQEGAAGGFHGCDLRLDSGLILSIEEDRLLVRIRLEEASRG